MPRGKVAVPGVLMPGPAKALALAGRRWTLRRPILSFFPVGVSTEANGGDALRGRVEVWTKNILYWFIEGQTQFSMRC